MPKSFLFIIPLTPVSHLTADRRILRKLCFDVLSQQTYPNWKALLVGNPIDEVNYGGNFIQLEFEGHKEEKLQKATEYVLSAGLSGDYIIRLDDDDVFNPGLLKKLECVNFDLYVDKYHSFWDSSTGRVSQKIRYWFPNTCIHKREHALSVFGAFPPGEYTRFKDQPFLIENEHNDFHFYYNQQHQIIFSEKNDPLYLRILNPGSITSLQAQDYSDYINHFGYWKINRLKSFAFLDAIKLKSELKIKRKRQNFIFLINSIKSTLVSLKNYNQAVINKGKS
jgi:hypothetical protein